MSRVVISKLRPAVNAAFSLYASAAELLAKTALLGHWLDFFL